MRIVHVLTRLLRAGSEENTLASCHSQAAMGHEVHLVHGRDFDSHYYDRPMAGIVLHKVDSLVHPLAPVYDVRAFRELVLLFRRLKADIVHTHQSKAGIVGRFAAQAAGVPHIVHGVHIVPFVNVGRAQRTIYIAAEKSAALFTAAFIDVSRGVRDLCVEAGVGRPEQHHVIHSGFDLDRFFGATPPEDWRKILGIGPDVRRPPVVVMLAALEQRKRHCEFLDVFPRVLASHPDTILVMAGEGPHREAVEAKIRALGLEANARLTGYRTDPHRLIALGDLCVLTSTREGLPRVIMQYVAAGRACVVNDIPGIDEVIVDDYNGIITPAHDMAATANAISDLLSDRSKLARLTAGAELTDLSSWRVEYMCAQIEEVYRGLMGGNSCYPKTSSTSTAAS
ncbi:glycosyltransferase [Xanthobacter flavus]|uniref:glycosyltransferase n=1 Tax=Xanthobacter flavus TaxID=281 RepID=UPI001AE32977|nr:glycosyltransferase [Xanthobacter flavus]MBP2151676.1 glycosyltransferase involved in cell wall biosynthesis [Xanthobacter flavus]